MQIMYGESEKLILEIKQPPDESEIQKYFLTAALTDRDLSSHMHCISPNPTETFWVKSACNENMLWPVVQPRLSMEEKDSIITTNFKTKVEVINPLI